MRNWAVADGRKVRVAIAGTLIILLGSIAALLWLRASGPTADIKPVAPRDSSKPTVQVPINPTPAARRTPMQVEVKPPGRPLLEATGVVGRTGVLAASTITGPTIAGGSGDSLALKPDGTVWAWGYNYDGELGNGVATTTGCKCVPTPAQVPGLAGVMAIAGGDHHSLALKSDGTVWAWGYNYDGELGNGAATTTGCRCVPTPTQVPGLAGVTAIAGGAYHSLALKSDGTVWAWGYNYDGELGNGTATTWGCQCVPTPAKVPGLAGVTAIAGGAHTHSLAVKSDGTVWAWGYNYDGELGNGTATTSGCSCSPTPAQVPGLSGIIAIAGGAFYSLALRSDGTVWAWGSDQRGELGNGATTTTGVPTPAQVPGLTGVTAIAGGVEDPLAVKSDGTVWAWGYNYDGELGNGATSYTGCWCVPTPAQVPGLAGMTAIAYVPLALNSDGTVWAWGDNRYGELGNGATSTTGCQCVPTAGQSLMSGVAQPAPITPHMFPPDPPTSVSAVGGNQQATVFWSPGAYDGGSPITGYTVSCTPPPGPSVTLTFAPGARSGVFTGLQGFTYSCFVRATNAVGDSPSSATVSVTPTGPRQIVFVHGINANARDIQRHVNPHTWNDLMDLLEQNFGAANKKIFPYYQDLAYQNPGGPQPCSPPQDGALYPDLFTAPLYTDPNSINSQICDSKGALAYSSAGLDDYLATIPGPATVIGNSMGGAITRGWLAMVQANAQGRSLSRVDSVIFIQGGQQGSYIGTVGESADRALTGSVIGDLGEQLSTDFNFDPRRPGVTDVAAGSFWYPSVNPLGVPAGLHYYNFYANLKAHIHQSLGFFTWGNVSADLGDVVFLPGDPSPTAMPPTGGARFLPGSQAVDRHEFATTKDLNMGPADFAYSVFGLGAGQATMIATAISDPASHFNYGDNIANGSTLVDSCNGGPQEPPANKIVEILMNPASGCNP
jgi:alpha-tubulin suppressor-like RCC1 family protein